MKLIWNSPNAARVEATNPDVPMTNYFKEKIREAWLEEAQHFMEEVSVAVRKCQPGERLVIESKPIKVEISRETLLETVDREEKEIS